MNSIISIQQLSNTYPGGQQVLKGINLEVKAGEIIGYIGPNGAGKSTTIKILLGMISHFSGEVQVLGRNIRTDALDIKRSVGYVPENAALYEVLTPLEYLTFIGRLYGMDDAVIERKAEDLLQLVGLSSQMNQRMNTFSKGMKQKVLLISGLIHNPEIIFLDEPLSGLDANAVILVKEILAQLRSAGKTIFYSSHIMDVVEKISDRIVIINQGQVIANGTFEELKEQAHSGSLERIFQGLTGDDTTQSKASDFLQALQ
ncbi:MULTISPECIES: ABC transporter ATP-binding protein [unclassified Siphonobacter]|uniref:ABC transporter ATP-binding protein n=1 Tax=unclassified Siphonobacter TaxID=2635712 RepID=UPI000CB3C864|nr:MULTISPECIES: ABC transporter ATP-binding protein [unclassified Siphonobacter]MDQ1088788.1 ABC-2 type transport system ATP-binding protein [Siphonobacter sp. SORGH_AS_1065]MDR6194972.1 ABC-2 type transport system ATP-binding protein [Siphonobacter sp. SORGH_AS_0500]PKK38485.1 ABC transporter [Siphonobacter sp. SORGH_AS_0500]